MSEKPMREAAPLVSLVLGTKGRTEELGRFLRSLACQTCRDVELVIVDQNEDDRVGQVLRSVPMDIPVLVIKSPPGLSRARNRGLRHARGSIVGFPDDDCWYPADLLARVLDAFDHCDADLVCGKSCDGDGRQERAWPETPRKVGYLNVWRCAISFTIFARRRVFDAVPTFDEELGVGAGTIYGSGEETDFLIRALRAGFAIDYTPDVVVFHPVKTATYDAETVKRTRAYAPGFGRVLKKNSYPAWFLWFALAKSLVKVLLGTVRRDPWYRRCGAEQVRGYLAGWRAK
jgi:glycosyltransferase involved in cell wall biosynthesis